MLGAKELLLCSVLLAPPTFESTRCSQHRRRHTLRLSLACSSSAQHASRLHANQPRFLSQISMGPRSAVCSSSAGHVEGNLAGETASLQRAESRIRKELEKPEYMTSPYDTAWVAMVPLPGSDFQAPCFPQCVQWIMQNQHVNGSWGINELVQSANKSVLLSTLACIIALKKWNVGPEHIRRGLQFIGRNFSIVLDAQIAAPVGFDITFPGMLSHAIGMGLEFPVNETHIGSVLHIRDMELNRLAVEESCGKDAYLAYVSEGLERTLDWNKVTKYKRENGSLLNSPAATAAALVQDYDDKALQYLHFLVSTFDGAVPSVYPLNIYCQLSLVDTLKKIGLSRYFSTEIKSILDKTYSFWLRRDEEIMLDVTTCAMAFRLLRMNGYDVSSDELSHVAKASTFHDTLQGYLNDTKSLLELYKASKVRLSENELILEKLCYWSGSLLTEKLNTDMIQNLPIFGEVEYYLTFPYYVIVEPLDHKRNIEHFDFGGPDILKTTSLPCRVKEDLLQLADRNFKLSQSVYQDELEHLKSWGKRNRLDQLQFVREVPTNSYLTTVTTISRHELSDARMACAKTIALVLVVDDFFDVGGSIEELQNLIVLVERWNEHHKVELYSDKVKVVFSAIYSTVNQLGEMACAIQNRDVTEHVVEIWLHYLRFLMTEKEWQRNQYVPSIEEYMENAVVGFGMGPIMLTTLYFVGEGHWECVAKEPEYRELFTLMSTCGRLLNDTKTYEKERRDGELNSIALLVLHSGSSMSVEEAKTEIEKSITSCRRQLLRLVVSEDGVVPQTCKDLFWRFYKTSHHFYFQTDRLASPKEMLATLTALINEPLKLQVTCPSLAVQSEK